MSPFPGAVHASCHALLEASGVISMRTGLLGLLVIGGGCGLVSGVHVQHRDGGAKGGRRLSCRFEICLKEKRLEN